MGFVLRSGATATVSTRQSRLWILALVGGSSMGGGSLKYLPPLRLLLSSFNLGLVTRHYCHCFIYYFRCVVLTGRCSWVLSTTYFTGTTTPIMAIGTSFSALEVVPLVVLGYEGYEHWSMQRHTSLDGSFKMACYYSSLRFAFWNMLGAGVVWFYD